MTPYEFRCAYHGVFVVHAPMVDGPGDTRPCPVCREAGRRVWSLTKQIMRPSGYRRSPDDPKFSDFRREMELGELRDDPSPVRMSPEEIARYDNPPIALPPDPERDHRYAQLIHQHWTEDLSDETVRRRELAAAAMARGELTTEVA